MLKYRHVWQFGKWNRPAFEWLVEGTACNAWGMLFFFVHNTALRQKGHENVFHNTHVVSKHAVVALKVSEAGTDVCKAFIQCYSYAYKIETVNTCWSGSMGHGYDCQPQQWCIVQKLNEKINAMSCEA